MKPVFHYLQQRAAEPSTWRGLIVLLTALGVALTPEQHEAVVALGLALAGLVGVFFPDELER